MYRHAHHHGHHQAHHYGHYHVRHHHYHHLWHNWHMDWSYCQHRAAHHAYTFTDEAASYNTQWFRVPGSFLGYVVNHSSEQAQPTSHGHHQDHQHKDHQPRVSRRPSKCTTHVASTRRCSRSHAEMRTTGKARRPATSKTDTKADPISGYACGSALRNMCTTPPCHDVGTGTTPAKAVGGAAVGGEAVGGAAGGGAARAEEPLSPSPSHPSQSLYSTALRRTPLFVKHESIQTTPSKTRTRSAFAVIRTDGETAGIGQSRTPAKEGDSTKSMESASTEPGASPGQSDASHHHHHHHHRACWHHQPTQPCGHPWPQPFHHQESCAVHQSKSENDTTWAGFFINISKDDWGVLLKEAWGRITNMVRRSRGTILLERNPPATAPAPDTATAHVPAAAATTAPAPAAPIGDSGEHADNAPYYDAHARGEHASYCYAHTASNEAYFYNHNCYQHRKAEDDTFFYSEKEPHNHSHFQEAPEQFFDCFESQVYATHQY